MRLVQQVKNRYLIQMGPIKTEEELKFQKKFCILECFNRGKN
jgi:hypothetical protein